VVEKVKEDVIALEHKKQLVQKEKQKKLLAELKKKELQQKKVKQKAIEQAFAQELKEQAEKSLAKQLLEEEQRTATAAGAAKARGEVNKYKALILQAIGRRWLVPMGADKKLYSQLLIRLAPDGSVMDVQITKSSGDIALDHSARDAVFKASPLPVPSEAVAFDQFRQFVLKVRPENIKES
jgi:colicin import membrane protein